MKEENEIYAVGLEIANSKVCAIAGKKDAAGNIHILNYAESPYDPEYESMSKGSVLNSNNITQTANRTLQELANKASLEIGSVNANFSNTNISLKSIKEAYTNDGNKFTVDEQILQKLVGNAKANFDKTKTPYLHVLPTDFYIDDMKIGKYPKGATGNKLTCQFNFVVTKKESIDALHSATDNLKYLFLDAKNSENEVSIDQLIYSGVADATSCLSVDDKQNGILLINIGAQLTEICVYKDHGLRHTHVIGFGAQNIIKDLMHAFNITEQQAFEVMSVCSDKPSKEIEINEVLELDGKNGLPKKQLLMKSLVMVIEYRLNEIISLASQNILDSGYARVLGNGIIITGAVARTGLVINLLEKTFHPLTVRVANPTINIQKNPFFELSHPKYSTAIGLLLASLGPVDQRIPTAKTTKQKKRMPLFGFKNNPISSIWERLEDPELKRNYAE